MKKIILAASLLAASNAMAEIKVSEPLVRLLPPGVPNTSAYMTMSNSDAKDRMLVGASSPHIKRIEMHNNVLEDGVMKMQKQEQLIIKANQTFKLLPGGYHLMLFGVKSPLSVDQIIPITLSFKNGEKIKVEAKVSSNIGRQHHHHH
ncbi:copper chaperone PCu(A)C [Alteromonas sp. a30]|uniref:copper chaperone PCu(A)C n=1 Tax=Alteromonas sp. a30 TaxID=2730917 RepID=UPI0022805AE9|nr:copper chaperone PCu(A)C [Alteromonas sp. a30]MCY7296546.1 copper chaperone PCu(A)C [Alteromonas sp. a30]